MSVFKTDQIIDTRVGTLEKDKAKKNRQSISGDTLAQRLTGSPTQIWRSRISWKITLAVFLTIMTVQAGMLSLTLKSYEADRLAELTESSRAAIVPLIEDGMLDLLSSPISEAEANRLLSSTKIRSLAIYSASDLSLIKIYGEPLALMLISQESLNRDFRSADGNIYETVLRPNVLRKPYIITVRLDSTAVTEDVAYYVWQTILIMLLMSAFVTSVLMLALGYWLLEPILFLRSNLLRASENPENPGVPASPYNPNDEIGGAIEIAHRLIQQNAENIHRIKSAAESQIHRLAYYDTLTGLPNRTLFLQTIKDQARKGDAENPTKFAVIAMDLDHFKDVNDTMGHNVGDAILRAVGKRLRASMPEAATVARSGEDEFAITMPLVEKGTSARDIAERVAGVIRTQPFKVFNENFQIRASIGVATYPTDGVDPDQVLKNADIALNRAKEEGRDLIKEYSEDFDRAVQQRFQMLRDLRDALEQDELSLNYQPQFDLKSGRLIGAEALLRWWKPDNSKQGGTFISPVDFIPVAEQSGLIVPIGEWVLHKACHQAASWHKEGIDIRIAVNVSGAQFHQSDLCAFVSKVLQESGLPANRLELEVTESVFMDDIGHTVQVLQNLHSLGVELAIDDFGTGYSSLSYLRQFPIDRLKIDRSFIQNALNNHDDASIARTIVRLGHSLNLKVIAEGVETKDHETFLIEEGCDEVQGFRYAKPLPDEKFYEFAKSYKGDLSAFDM